MSAPKEPIFDLLPVGGMAYLGYVLLLNGIVGAWLMSMIVG